MKTNRPSKTTPRPAVKYSKKPAPRKRTSASSSSFLSKLLHNKRTPLLIFILLFAAVGSYLLIKSFAAPGPVIVERFVNKPDKGLIWDGLSEPGLGSPCVSPASSHVKGHGLLEIKDRTGKHISCTHGPDPAPDSVDIRKSAVPVKTGENDITARQTTGTTSGTSTAATTGGVACDGDGQSGSRIQAMYVRASDKPDRYDQFAQSFQGWVQNISNEFVESSQQTNGPLRAPRFVHDANCNVVVSRVILSPTGDDGIGNSVAELREQGYNRADRKYMLWMDANVYCGIADSAIDDRAAADNQNNFGPSYARTDSGCWGFSNSSEAHELMHTLGGVQLSAPHTSGGFHCLDNDDRMCYADSQDDISLLTYPCPPIDERLFDCNKDDYFYSGTPPAGNYLATHYNTANSSFLTTTSNLVVPPPQPPSVTSTCNGSTNTATISWQATVLNASNYYVQITSQSDWLHEFWQRIVPAGTGSITDVPTGFTNANGSGATLTLQRGYNYRVRVYYEGPNVFSGDTSFYPVYCGTSTTDTINPSTTLASPANGSTLSGTVNVTVNASDNVGVRQVDFMVDGALVGTDATSPYTYSWDTTKIANGNHTVSAKAYDTAGNQSTVSTVSVTVNNTVVATDTTAPVVTISSPVNGSRAGNKVNIRATASDNVGVSKMQIYIDGILKTTSTNGVISYDWNSRKASTGSHTVTVKAYDAAGNLGQSSITVYK